MAEIVSTAHVTDAYMCIAVKDNARGGMTMTEYIKREAVERNLADIYMGLGGYKTRDAFYKAIDLVHRYPAADVAPVVRCRDCKYRFRNNGHDKNGCPITDADIWMDDNSFCSYGKRKEGAE